MPATPDPLERRLRQVERSLRRANAMAALAVIGLIGILTIGARRPPMAIPAELRTHRLVVVDDSGRARVEIGQDDANTQRVSRSAGLTLFDEQGSERGGFITMADGSVVLGLDAPAGVGAPMRDRIGMKVEPDGAADVMLLDNQTRAVAKLTCDGAGHGGVQVFKWDMTARRIHIRTVLFDGDRRDSVGFGG
jgi:hypothetical protein